MRHPFERLQVIGLGSRGPSECLARKWIKFMRNSLPVLSQLLWRHLHSIRTVRLKLSKDWNSKSELQRLWSLVNNVACSVTFICDFLLKSFSLAKVSGRNFRPIEVRTCCKCLDSKLKTISTKLTERNVSSDGISGTHCQLAKPGY